MGLGELIEAAASTFQTHPGLWAFTLSFMSNAVPYMTVPYLLLIAAYGAGLGDPWTKLTVAVTGGLGAALGKLVVYMVGSSTRRFMSEETKRNLELFTRLFRRSAFIAVVVFAATPLPDDVIYVPLGVAGYSKALFLAGVAIGKVIITGLAVLFGSAMAAIIPQEGGGVNVPAIAATVAVGVLLSIVVARTDWSAVARELERRGVYAAAQVLLRELARSLTPRGRSRGT